jgi:hypothetical protein
LKDINKIYIDPCYYISDEEFNNFKNLDIYYC